MHVQDTALRVLSVPGWTIKKWQGKLKDQRSWHQPTCRQRESELALPKCTLGSQSA